MSEYIDQLFDNLRRDPFASDPTASTTFELQAQDSTEPTAPVGWIAEGVIDDANLVPNTTLIDKVTSLPTLPDPTNYPESKVVYLTTDQKLYRSTGSTWTAAIPSTDITGTITETQIASDAITTPKLAANAVVASKIAASTITGDKIAANTITAGNIVAGTITATEIATGTITANKIQAGTITANEIANSTITGGKIAGTTITAANISGGTITSTEIANSTITGGKIASATITGGNIAGATITAANITAGTITATEIANSTITGGKIASATITGSNISSATITGSNISGSTITASNIVDATITGAKIASATITDANIGSLNAGKLTAGTITIAPSGGVSAISSTNFNVTSTGSVTANDITLGGPTITVDSANTGRVSLVPATGQGSATIYMGSTVTGTNSSATRASGSSNVVVTYVGSDISVGMFITTASATTSLVVTNARITAVSAGASFTYQTSSTTAVTGTLTSWTAYKTLKVLGPQVTQFYSSTSNPGSIATGSLILGSNAGLNAIGNPSTPIPSDGEIVWNSAVTPTYGGGANLYSSNGTDNISTSGNMNVRGTTLEVGVNGSKRGTILARGDGTNGGYIALYSGVGSAGATMSFDVANSRMNINNDLNVQGALTSTNLSSYIRSDASTASTTSIPAGSFQSHSLSWTSTGSTPIVVASPYMSTASSVMMTAVVFGRSATGATIYLYNATSTATTVGRYALGIAVI